jgi:hypothetical protein
MPGTIAAAEAENHRFSGRGTLARALQNYCSRKANMALTKMVSEQKPCS